MEKTPFQLNTDNEKLLVFVATPLTLSVLGGIRLTGLDRLRVTLKITVATEMAFPLNIY
jgi:DNA primase